MRINRKGRTPGFTLVELLVVIAILGILMSLILPAVQKIRGKGPEVKCGQQISQLSAACTQFKADFGVFPPDNGVDAAKVLQAMYPRVNIPSPYNAGGTLTNPNQFLVHFLGGPQQTGWAIDQPTFPGPNATTKKGPYYDFQSAALVGGQLVDPWEVPYQYCASTSGGGYADAAPPGGMPAYREFGSTSKWSNTGSVQIISAGPNKRFGPGGSSRPLPNTDGFDDLANFNGGYMLGATP